MRVLVLSQYYDPDPIPKPSGVAQELRRRGHDVLVICGLPNYPSGRLSPGYRLVPARRERRNGISLLRVFEIPYHGRGTVGRLLNYTTFMISAAFAGLFTGRPDVIYVWCPPPTVGVAASFLAALRRARFVLDLQDIWPDELITTGLMRRGVLASLVGSVERFVYGRAAAIVVVTDGARRNLLEKGVPESKVTVLPNWMFGDFDEPPDPQDISTARRSLGPTDAFVVTFAGNIGSLQGLETVLEAARHLSRRRDIVFRFIGDGSERKRLEMVTRRAGLDQVTFLGPRPREAMAPLLAASDALLVHLAPGPITHVILPTKTAAYMSVGRPIIAAIGGATASLIEECGAGVVVPPGDPIRLAQAIERLAAMPPDERDAMGQRGRACASERFSREKLFGKLEDVLTRTAGLYGNS